jgi:hypothetical protein
MFQVTHEERTARPADKTRASERGSDTKEKNYYATNAMTDECSLRERNQDSVLKYNELNQHKLAMTTARD